MNENRYCVIMAGGSANHFWPISRKSRPKQFLDADGSGKSFIRKTYERFAGIIPAENILVVTLSRFAGLVKEQIPEIDDCNILMEPYGRNTAPCILFSTCEVLRRNPDAVIVTTPADHAINDEDAFRNDMLSIMEHAENNQVLMTLGILPTAPETNYGYIQVTGGRGSVEEKRPVKVKTFVEKPDSNLAEVFCKSGEFLWNSGIYAWKASLIKEELEKYTPEVISMFKGIEDALGTAYEQAFLERAYSDCPKISIDYGVMENTDRAWLYPGSFGWQDADTWESIMRNMDDRDPAGNVFHAAHTLKAEDSGTLLMTDGSHGKKLYAIKGLKDYIVIDTDDALLICPRDDKQYKDLLSGLGMPEYEDFR